MQLQKSRERKGKEGKGKERKGMEGWKDGRMEGWKDGRMEQKIECKRNGKQKKRAKCG